MHWFYGAPGEAVKFVQNAEKLESFEYESLVHSCIKGDVSTEAKAKLQYHCINFSAFCLVPDTKVGWILGIYKCPKREQIQLNLIIMKQH